MASRHVGRKILRPLLYATGAATITGGVLYVSYRPQKIPGLGAAAVPPPTYGEGGIFRPPAFPAVKTRDEQIADLKRSSGTIGSTVQKAKSGFNALLAGQDTSQNDVGSSQEEPYDLLIIGGGATGSGIALDAATRGLKVAVVERDDFSSGTSSKSTKLVHGGVRYLEKAVWELDYGQYVAQSSRESLPRLTCHQVQACERSLARAKILFGYCTTSVILATYYDPPQQLVAGTVLLGRNEIL